MNNLFITGALLASATVGRLTLAQVANTDAPADNAAPTAASTPVPAAAPTAPASSLTVAVLDFSADNAGVENVGQQISIALTALLTGEDGVTLVDRSSFEKTLEEQGLNLSGLVDNSQAIQIGKVVGARIIVTGKAFPLGDKLFITAKLIGTETSLVDAVLVKGMPSGLDAMVTELAQKIAQRVRENGQNLVARQVTADDPIPVLKLALEDRQLPTVAVVVPERHIGRAQPAPDPAVETELKLLLRQCGFTVIDTQQNDLADWAKTVRETDPDHWPRSLAGADVVIVGEAFSEFAGRIGNLISATARAELNVIDRKTGHILIADRTTTRDVDLSENIAGRKALQKAGYEVGVRMLTKMAETLPVKED